MSSQLPTFITSEKVFLINRSELEGRIDSFYYSPQFQVLGTSITRTKFKKVPLKSIFKSITNGFDFREYQKTGIPYIKVANVKQGYFDFSNVQYINFSSEFLTKKIQLKKGGLLLTRKGTFGYALSLDDDYENVISSEVFYIELDKEIVHSKYLEIFFNSAIGQKLFKRASIGAIMGSLSQDAVKNIVIPVPPLEEQQKIINQYLTAYNQKQQKETEAKALLRSIDDYLLEELGVILPEKDASLEKRIFTTSFSEITGKRIDSYFYQDKFIQFFKLLSDTQYPILAVKNISTKITSGITPLSGGSDYTSQDDGVPFVRSGNINIDGELNFSDLLYITKKIHSTQMKSSQLKKYDLMIASVGATIGQIGIYLDSREANINQAIALVRLKEGFNPCYIKEIMKSSIGQFNLNRLKRPVARANINLDEIASMNIIVPPLEKQNEIAAHIQTIRERAKQLQEQASTLLKQAKQDIEGAILGNI